MMVGLKIEFNAGVKDQGSLFIISNIHTQERFKIQVAYSSS